MKDINGRSPFPILMADDDADDRMLAEEALAECRIRNELRFVEDGEALLNYLKRKGRFGDAHQSPRPGLILLDWNMPRKSGWEALQEIKSDPELRTIPVIVLTTSNAEEDITQAYQLGANSYITKPVTFDGLVEVMRGLKHFWLEIVAMPQADELVI